MNEKITLKNTLPKMGATSQDLAECIIERIGLLPRKKGSTQHMHKTFIEFYERSKQATAQKDPKLAVLTVDEMALYAKISRQTMYEYLQRWLELGIIQKVTYLGDDNKVIIGYKLSGNSLEDAFSKTQTVIKKNLEQTQDMIAQLQKSLKNEKISAKMSQNKDSI
jgi:predicted transcriptional regulator